MTTPINFGQAVQWIVENPYTLIASSDNRINRFANNALTPLRSLQMDKPWRSFGDYGGRLKEGSSRIFHPINRALAILLVIPATIVAVAAKVFNAWYSPEIRAEMSQISFFLEIERTTDPKILEIAGGAGKVQHVRINGKVLTFDSLEEMKADMTMIDLSGEVKFHGNGDVFRGGEAIVRGGGDKPFLLFRYVDKTTGDLELAFIHKNQQWEVEFSGTLAYLNEDVEAGLEFCKNILSDGTFSLDKEEYEMPGCYLI